VFRVHNLHNDSDLKF